MPRMSSKMGHGAEGTIANTQLVGDNIQDLSDDVLLERIRIMAGARTMSGGEKKRVAKTGPKAPSAAGPPISASDITDESEIG